MASIILRQVKGSPLTTPEIDGNFTNLNNAILDLENASGPSNAFDQTLLAIQRNIATRYFEGGTITENRQFKSIVYAPDKNLFVAVATKDSSSSIITSSDGLTWTPQSVTNNDYRAVTYSQSLGLFVAVHAAGTSNSVLTSSDGITWTARTSVSGTWNSVVWAPDKNLFVAVATSSTAASTVMTSPDGITWTTRTGIAGTWNKVLYAQSLGLFVAIGKSNANNTNNIMTSTTGTSWTARTTASTSVGFSTGAWSPELSLFVVIASQSINTSPDGITWTQRSSSESGQQAISWSSTLGRFVIYGLFTNKISADGLNWITYTPNYGENTDTFIYDSVFSATLGYFVAVGSNISISTDGVNWKKAPFVSQVGYSTIEYSPSLGVYVSCASDGKNRSIVYSYNGINWLDAIGASANINQILWNPTHNQFVAVGGAKVMTSPDGITWTTRSTPVSYTWQTVAYSSTLNKYVVVGQNGVNIDYITSADGITWTTGTGFTSGQRTTKTARAKNLIWSSVHNLFVLIGINSGSGNALYIYTSPDAVTWTTRTQPAGSVSYTSNLTYNAELGKYVLFTTSNMITSTDAVTWTATAYTADTTAFRYAWSPEMKLFVNIYGYVSTNGINWKSKPVPINSLGTVSGNDIVWSSNDSIFVMITQDSTYISLTSR